MGLFYSGISTEEYNIRLIIHLLIPDIESEIQIFGRKAHPKSAYKIWKSAFNFFWKTQSDSTGANKLIDNFMD